jgi:acetyl esterase/lipase
MYARLIIILTLLMAMTETASTAKAQATSTYRKKAARLLEENDANKDGKLSRDEFPARHQKLFDTIDTNKDGFITIAEDIAYRASRSAGKKPQQAAQPDRTNRSRLPEGVTVERDIVYARAGDRDLPLDIYIPDKAVRPMPVIIWVHGGGWKGGSKSGISRPAGVLSRGYALVSVEYRLSGEAIWPAQIEDCKAAVRWTRANAAKYGLDPDRIGAWGSSAGGHLVAMMGVAADAEKFDTHKEYAGVSARVRAVCDWFGPTDFTQMDAHRPEGARLVHDDPDSPESRLVGGPIQKEPYLSVCAEANPINYVTKDDPPILIMHGDMDTSVPVHQSELFYKALKKADVDATFYIVKGGGHGFRNAQNDTSEDLSNMAIDFFDKHLKTRKPRANPGSRNQVRNRPQLRQPTYGDVKYGPHKRNVLDFYQAKSDNPVPLAVYIHGGGFRGGSKKSVNQRMLSELLAASISVAAIEYRFVADKPLPAAHHDSLRALQFIRSKAGQWNIDKKRVGAFGGSAGAQICMWLAFHDEMADPLSSDPLKRESSRLTCVVTNGGQTTMEFDWWKKWVPGYDKPHRDRTEVFGDVTDEELGKIVEDISAMSLISADDPPIFMTYGMKPEDPIPTDPARARGWKVHHVIFGVKLKEKMDALGVEADLKYPDAQTTYRSGAGFFIKKLKPD